MTIFLTGSNLLRIALLAKIKGKSKGPDPEVCGVPLAYFPRLLRATPEQHLQCEMSGNGTGLHWEALDEDISVKGLLIGVGDQMQDHTLTA